MFTNSTEGSKITRSDWALLLVETAKSIDGVTRLQKYAFLAAMRIRGLTKEGFYSDWNPSNYGPFSQQLADDLTLLMKDGVLAQTFKVNEYGYKVAVIWPTPKGDSRFNEMNGQYRDFESEIKKITEMYKDQPLVRILSDVYKLYPAYATKSKIKAEVGRKIFESDSYLNPEYD